jgi:hypothetical protein
MNNSKTILVVVFLMVGTLLTTAVTTMVPAAYADNKQKAEDDSAASIADCDENEVEQAGFDCIAIAANDVEIETQEEPPEEERATLFVCKTENIPNMSPEDFSFSILAGNDPDPVDFEGDNSDGCVDVDIGPGEYIVSEETLPPELGIRIEVEGDCIQDDESQGIATGIIQAGETQTCTYFNLVEN